MRAFMQFSTNIPVVSCIKGNYMFKVSNRNIRARCKICSKLTIKTLERRQWHRPGVFIVNFEHISHLALVFVNFEQVKTGWAEAYSGACQTSKMEHLRK